MVFAAIVGFLILRVVANDVLDLFDETTAADSGSNPESDGIIESATISYQSFASVDGMSFAGSAKQDAEAISLTRKTEAMQAGAAWFEERQPVADGFETTFLFQIDHISRWTIGDGFAFVIQNAGPRAVGEGADGIGYKNIPFSLAVEFDTVYHDYADDPQTPISGDPGLVYSANHVAVHTMGTEPNTSHSRALLDYAALDPVFLYDRQPHVALIRYVPGHLSVYVDNFKEPALEVPVDLAKTLALGDGSAFVGFTAGAAGFYADHKIHGWAFESPCLVAGCDSG